MALIQKDKLLEAGILIPLATIFAIASVYYYELGFFCYLKIPIVIIQVELARNIQLIFGFFSVCWGTIIIVEFFVSFIPKHNDWSKGKRLISVIIIILLFCIFFRNCLSDQRNFVLITSLIIGGLLWLAYVLIIKYSPKEEPIRETLIIKTSGLAGPLIFFASIICMIFFQIGYESGDGVDKFYKPDKKTFLLRKYSGYSIYGVTDSIGKPFKEFIVSRTSTDADTLIPSK